MRAGVPLDRGLLGAGSDLPGGLRRITTALGQRLSRGESLPEALEAEKRAIPPLYRAVVEAGARSGRLSAALEGLARYVRGYSEARAAIGVALWYPILVLSLAYGLFLGLVTVIIPRFIGAFESLGLEVIRPAALAGADSESSPRTGGRYGRSCWCCWPWPGGGPESRRRSRPLRGRLLRLFPWMRSMLADYEAAGYADLLALLLEHQVAYPRAVELAAEATGNPTMIEGAGQLAAAVAARRGPGPGRA